MRHLVLLCAVLIATAAEPSWKTYNVRDRSFSFEHPPDWSAAETGSAVTLTAPSTSEEIVVTPIDADPSKSPADLAEAILAQRRSQTPDFRAGKPAGDRSIAGVDAAYSRDGRQYRAIVLVLKSATKAIAFSYTAPAESYQRPRAVQFLQTLMSSVKKGKGHGKAGKAPALIGTWTTSRSGGVSSENYEFRPNGVYRYSGSGQGAGGAYTVDGEWLILKLPADYSRPTGSAAVDAARRYSLDPVDGTRRFRWRLHDPDTLVLTGFDTCEETWLYRRK